MIDEKIFESGMELLHENYEHIRPKPLSKRIQNLWRQYLGEKLTNEEFTAAIKYFILHNRYWPTASDLADYIHGGKEVKGLQEWALIVDAAGRGDSEERLAYLTERSKIALKAIGGIQSVGLANAFDLSRLEKKFVSVYTQCSSEDRKALAQSAQEHTETPRNLLHDEEEQERNRQMWQKRWEEKNGKSGSTSDL